MARWVGVDYGKKRIGLAISDPGETIASPAGVLDGSGRIPADAAATIAWCSDNEVEGIVVGLPLNMDGTIGQQARLTQEFINRLRNTSSLPIEAWDERLSSYQADQFMDLAGVAPTKRKGRRDALAAQVILQSFLDARRSSAPERA